jgi:hypothetical protein
MTLMMDDAVGDVVTALKLNGLWGNTLLVWSSDNGAAIELDTGAKSAYPLRGGYCTDWEGGVRAPALLNGGVLPEQQRGQTLDGLVHISDWWPTFVVGLAGGDTTDAPAAAAGLPPVDGMNLWPYLSGDRAESPRIEVGFTPLNYNETANRPSMGGDAGNNDSAIIVVINGSKLKFITDAVAQSSWVGPQYPNGSRPDNAPIGACALGETGCWDTWATVQQCTVPPGCTDINKTCKLGCLFNLSNDPTEHVDLGTTEPALARDLYGRLKAYSKTLYDPDRGVVDAQGACGQMARNGGFFGPWLRNGQPPM